ncbi:MAG: dihydrolipoamide acetyltransferase family protein [Bacteroidota bacterium]
MAEVIRMPKMSDTMEEGIIATWLKKEGDTVQAGDILAEVETDKATMELEAYEDGTLLHIGVPAKAAAPVNGIIAIIGEKGEDITSLLQETEQPTSPPAAQQATTPTPTLPQSPSSAPQPQPSTSRIFASPLAKKIAQTNGYDLATIQGTGTGGRIIKRDVAALAPAALSTDSPTTTPITLPPIVSQEAHEDQPATSIRKTIAQRLSESKNSAPHFYLTAQISMDELVAARPSINAHAPVKISFNDIILKATALALRQHPAINVAWLGDTIRHYQHIHLGVAMALTEGLLVPVIRFADQKSLAHIAAEVQAFHQKAQQKQLKPQELTGSTFTISNLGMMGIETFTAIINPPAACILAIGEIKQVPVVKDGAIVPGHVMKATLSCDHRAVDGAVGAAFLKTFRALLEAPLTMLVH